jgi:nucleotide-binding universal stress UspA family protein/quercetin dioxygenase-like cupin family protein
MSTIQTILQPTDFSLETSSAFQVACSLAKDYNAQLFLLHVMRPSVAPVLQEPVPNPLEPAEAQEHLHARFPWPEPSEPSIVVDHRVAEGDVVEEILYLAQAIHCDLIVMGTRGRTGLNRFFTSSIAEEVVRRATCPVMTIKHAPAESSAVPAPAKLLAKPGQLVDVRQLGPVLASTPTRKLVVSQGIEIARLILPAGKEVFEYKSKGALVVHCLEGRLAVTALGKTIEMESGQLVYLPKDEPHTFKGIENSALLLTTLLPL